MSSVRGYDRWMPRARVNGIELEYEVSGRGEPLMLVMGIGAQLVHWPPALLDRLERKGFQLIRFDHRDCGLSSRLEQLGVPAWREAMVRSLLGLPVRAPYTLLDMADDVAGLMDHLGIERAHVAGVSMGGMIAQTMAIAHPHRMLTLTSIMSHTGARRVSVGKLAAIRALLGPAPRCRSSGACARAASSATSRRFWPPAIAPRRCASCACPRWCCTARSTR